MSTPEISELNLGRLERLLELWTAMIEIETAISSYNAMSGEIVRFVGTNFLGERSYDVDTDDLHDQRRTLAYAIASVLGEERRQRAVRAIGLPVRDDELAAQFQHLWSASSGIPLGNVRHDDDQWRKFQIMLFNRGIVV